MVSIMLNGFLTGLLLQIAIGPVFFFILNISLQKTVIDGFFAVIAVTLVDYIFIALAVLGVGKLLEKHKIKLTLGITSSIVLILFGKWVCSLLNRQQHIGFTHCPVGTASFHLMERPTQTSFGFDMFMK